MARYTIGIDLGTTNIAVAYQELGEAASEPVIFKIPQIIEEGEHRELETLPSFLFFASTTELKQGTLDLPWANNRDFCVGFYARKKSSESPNRTICSAKSWLSVSHVERLSPILPWNQEDNRQKLSPVETTKRYLEHLKDSWNYKMAQDTQELLFENQEIILTVPASFDAVARDLTIQSAEFAGIQVTLLEEPQAAFYAWIQGNMSSWRDLVNLGDRILVCDIGGGTTDFSLIEVTEKSGNLELSRIAVGNHILLGGDNFDLALAYFLSAKLKKEKKIQIDQHQMAGLTHACRNAKEKLFSDPNMSPQNITILGRGTSVIGGSITTELTYDNVTRVILDGFLPLCSIKDSPQSKARTGLREFGLSYESDPAITKHLASFLSTHLCKEGGGNIQVPSLVLFNGGVCKASVIQQRILGTLSQWNSNDDKEPVCLLGSHLDLAVATGSCCYGKVARSGEGFRIKAGSPHTYYLGIESNQPAVPGFSPPLQGLCVVPFGMEEGTEAQIPYSGLGLVVGESTVFRFFASNSRKKDKIGQILDDIQSCDVSELPELFTEIPIENSQTTPGTLVPIHVRTILSNLGTLEVWCIDNEGKNEWKLEYELRAVNVDLN